MGVRNKGQIIGTRNLIYARVLYTSMVLEGTGRHYVSETSRTILYISQRLASDSAWPFEHKDPLKIKIDGDRVIVEKREEENRKEAAAGRKPLGLSQ